MTPAIIDAHVHLPCGQIPDIQYCGFSDYEPAVEFAKRAGVTGMVFNMWNALNCRTAEELDAGNELALSIYASDPTFFYPGVVIAPNFPETSIRWIREFSQRGLFWCGELLPKDHPDYTAPEWQPLFEACHEAGMILQLHMSPSIAALAKRMPDLTIIHSHIDMHSLPLMADHPNIYLDFSGFSGLRLGSLEAAVSAFGTERILFGSDFTVYNPSFFVQRLKSVVTNPHEQDMILSGNLLRLLRQRGSHTPFKEV